jgi:hypothetical protein
MLPLMTTAQIFFSFVAAAMMVAGCWFYFRGGPFRKIRSIALVGSGYMILFIVEGGSLFWKLFAWGLGLYVLKFYVVEEEGKLKLRTPEEDEQPEPSGN